MRARTSLTETRPASCLYRGSSLHRNWVAWFVDAELAAARQARRRQQAPSLVADRLAELNPLGAELLDGCVDVVAEQVQLVLTRSVGRMDRSFRRWQPEDQPAIPGVDGLQAERVAEERPDIFRLLAVDNDVSTGDHSCLLVSLCRRVYTVVLCRTTDWTKPV